MGCTSSSQCTDVLANTTCLSSQCACVSGYIGTTCTGKTQNHPKCWPIFENIDRTLK